MPRLLLLGGTQEAGALARALADAGAQAIYSYAGRTAAPVAPALPCRVGGFGGADGLAQWLRSEGIAGVIDATHPFAARMSRNAIAACAATSIPLLALERPAWTEQPGDDWQRVPDVAAAVAALPEAPARVFLAIGRQNLAAFAARPGHAYLLRLVDPPEGDLPLPQATVLVDRGPFSEEGDLAMMRQQGVQIVVAKNAGGSGAVAKIVAARTLGLPVVMIDRPALPPRPTVATVDEVLHWIHDADLGV
ncbi:cobalt-precorrin-6A reductase [Fuscovulum blasticum]|uniref:cobalt-precorrin-6A reductase n=1 Tax=Fuscovulum blasticum TaxID=1075 RepID=UPI000D3E3A07|nr:cobalt-precorrin-6A reductase [Fuscovulum blasticum]AWD21010.1 cobalt-precorrin-6A reductase [Fuscovulum blasticum]